METWQLLVGLAGMLVFYAALVRLLGAEVTPVDALLAVVFGSIGLYLGNRLTERMKSGDE